ncbi:MAG: wax ester/triacylglycerol synthase family O-acyltransferase [Rubricoccaceae bacterium]|nr:wax ester/triacylglycerol synthase family O-acyltransferase [Rubricoccaceae bacterium]
MPGTQRMRAADVAWLRMESPTNPMTISGVLMTGTPMPRETLLQLLQERLLVYPRFRMRVDDPEAATPHWVPDEPFDLDRHVVPYALPAPGDQTALQESVSALMSTPLSFDHAPWAFHHVERYGEGSAIIARLHHCIADGIALMHVLLSMSDELWDPGRTAAPAAPQAKRPFSERLARAARTTVRGTGRLATGLKTGVLGTGTLARLTFMPSDPETPYKGENSAHKRAAWSRPLPLDDIKAVGRATGAKVNDVLLAAAAGALRRYMDARGEPTEGVEVRAAVPFNVRPLDRAHELGNAFSLVFLKLPVGVEDPVERLRLLKRRMDRIKRSTEPAVVYGILQTIGRTPHLVHDLVVKLFASKATAVMTNVPGPPERVHLLGVPLRDLMFWVPQAGDLALGLSILSYDGRVLVGVASDATLADPSALVEAFEAEFEALAARYADAEAA